MNQFVRTKILLGEENMDLLKNSSVLIFGIGGVGGYVADALCRAGIFNLTLVDNDIISESNINRHICANLNTVGKLKTEVMRDHIFSINPDAKVTIINQFVDEKNVLDILSQTNKNFSFAVDAIDTISSKIQIVLATQKLKIPIISSMGMGNKINPTAIKLDDIYKTKYCPLAKIMRHELKKHAVKKLRVCYSIEQPKKIIHCPDMFTEGNQRKIIASISFVPATAGLLIAYDIVKNLIDYSVV